MILRHRIEFAENSQLDSVAVIDTLEREFQKLIGRLAWKLPVEKMKAVIISVDVEE